MVFLYYLYKKPQLTQWPRYITQTFDKLHHFEISFGKFAGVSSICWMKTKHNKKKQKKTTSKQKTSKQTKQEDHRSPESPTWAHRISVSWGKGREHLGQNLYIGQNSFPNLRLITIKNSLKLWLSLKVSLVLDNTIYWKFHHQKLKVFR